MINLEEWNEKYFRGREIYNEEIIKRLNNVLEKNIDIFLKGIEEKEEKGVGIFVDLGLDFQHLEEVGDPSYYVKFKIRLTQDVFDEIGRDIDSKELDYDIVVSPLYFIANINAFNWFMDYEDFDDDDDAYQYFCEIRFNKEESFDFLKRGFDFLKKFAKQYSWEGLKILLKQNLEHMINVGVRI